MPSQPPGGQQPAGETPLAPSEMLRNRNFLLLLDSTAVPFTECIGLGMRIEPIRYRESGAGSVVRALPGSLAYSWITLCYGLPETPDLWNWLKEAADGNVQRRSVTISQLGNDGSTPRINWNLYGAWPCQWSGVPFDAMGNEVAIEQLQLAYDRMDRL